MRVYIGVIQLNVSTSAGRVQNFRWFNNQQVQNHLRALYFYIFNYIQL